MFILSTISLSITCLLLTLSVFFYLLNMFTWPKKTISKILLISLLIPYVNIIIIIFIFIIMLRKSKREEKL